MVEESQSHEILVLVKDGDKVGINDAGIVGHERGAKNLSRGHNDPISWIPMKRRRQSGNSGCNSWRKPNSLDKGRRGGRFEPVTYGRFRCMRFKE